MIETIKIVKKNHAGYAIINKSDFDPKIHQPYKTKAELEADEAAAKKAKAEADAEAARKAEAAKRRADLLEKARAAGLCQTPEAAERLGLLSDEEIEASIKKAKA